MDWATIKEFRTTHCPKCANLLDIDKAVLRCKLVCGTNCEHAIETGKCRYQEVEAK
ncbi:MAG: hypothetical protein O0V67_01630 [Methanocorpusculum sp.]|nr:hypothetical protein [Methanocorpusculum sp.]